MGRKNQLAVSGLVVIVVAAVALAAAFAFTGDDVDDEPAAAVASASGASPEAPTAAKSTSQEAPAGTSQEVVIDSSGVDENADDALDPATPALEVEDEPVVASADSPLVEPDPDYLRKLQQSRIRPIGWTTGGLQTVSPSSPSRSTERPRPIRCRS